jgi:hypothetical protein
MTGEQFLNSIRFLDAEISALDYERVKVMDQRQDLLDAAEKWGGLSGIVVQHGISSKTESIGVALASIPNAEFVARKLNGYQARINRKIDKLVNMKHKAMDYIEKVSDAKYRALLMLRFINCYRWATIAELMSYNEHYVRIDLVKAAIPAFEKLWEKENSYQKLP